MVVVPAGEVEEGVDFGVGDEEDRAAVAAVAAVRPAMGSNFSRGRRRSRCRPCRRARG